MSSIAEVDWKTPHLWRKTVAARTAAPALAGGVETDLLVVGGGLTGLGAALGGVEAGLRVVLLEGNEIGSAASGRNNGQVIPGHSKASASEIVAAWGPVTGGRYNEMIMGAASYLFDTVRRFGIDAHAVQNGWMQSCHSAAAMDRSRKLYDDWRAIGHDVEWLDGAEASRITGSRYLGAWKARNGGHINPFGLVTGLASALEGLGVTICENTRAESITRDGAGWRVTTAGGTVRARKVVLATNALTRDIWPKLGRAMVPFRVYDAATRPIPEPLRAQIFVGNVGVSDTRHDIRAFHYDVDFRIVTGGTHTFWHRAEARGLKRIQAMLRDAFPQLGDLAQVSNYWEGTFAVVPDRKPRLFRLGDGLMFGGIYSGRGVAASLSLGRRMGMNAAEVLGDDDMPLPVTPIRTVPSHWVATQVANHIHPWHRLQDRLG